MPVPERVCPRTHIDRTAADDVLIRSLPPRIPLMSSTALSPSHTAVGEASDVTLLQARVEELTRERDQLTAAVDILQEVSSSLHFSEVLQRIAKRLADLFGLDRCSIYLAGDVAEEVRMVATFENPELGNLVVDLGRYPELKRAFESGQTVFIPEATRDPTLERVWGRSEERRVGKECRCRGS